MKLLTIILPTILLLISSSLKGHSFEDIVIERPIRRIDVRELFVEYYSNESPNIDKAVDIKLDVSIHNIQKLHKNNEEECIIFVKIHQSWNDHRFNFKGRVTSLPNLEERIWKPNVCIINALNNNNIIEKKVDIFENSTVSFIEIRQLSFPIINNNVTITFEDIPLNINDARNNIIISNIYIKEKLKRIILSHYIENDSNNGDVSLILILK
uniref:Neur_chan_LBD domain-containing protein n=1 Tax=Parastrongyloides trichosuri TaxID=131310 RepID=A0A0N4ZPU3_PARTI